MHLSAKTLEEQLERVRTLESRLTFRLSVLSKLLDQQAQAMLDGTGINLTGYRILNVINTLGSTSISDISRFCGIDRAQVSRSATELEKQGLVQFEDDAVSKRKKLVAISPDGRALLEAVKPAFVERNEKLDELLGPERKAAVTEAINLMTEHVLP
ncbi:MarR family transcriptional regulator [Phaeobacter sp. J2-8]|uniref:MarR family winged helix-turn-helix transcriptional regulator n=1 Tax=Phaeobacter sp. J2-8 TaxID=2931394 RepID=UPI001FD091A3|nr:MarR family transcriptional regulator [Phaeobacter sp. J2-8]MCJ7874694.1 MarR family transcriptional regulator [Phaeobacter sp. J2-8]